MARSYLLRKEGIMKINRSVFLFLVMAVLIASVLA